MTEILRGIVLAHSIVPLNFFQYGDIGSNMSATKKALGFYTWIEKNVPGRNSLQVYYAVVFSEFHAPIIEGQSKRT